MATWKKVIVSGSNISQLNNDSGYIASIGGGILSASAEGDAQGQIKLNGVNVDVNLMGASDSPTFTTVTANLSGTADTASYVAGASVDGDISGNAGSATVLETARNIGGVSFDGSANIDLPGVNAAGNQDTTGNAATATALATTRAFTTTGDVVLASANFDGSSNFTTTATIQAGAVENTMFAANAKTAISGAFTSTSASIASDIAALESAAYDLDVSDGSNTGAIGNSETLTIQGTSNEVEVAYADGSSTFTVGLPSTISVDVTGNVTGTADTASYIQPGAIDGDIALGSGTSGNYVSALGTGTGVTIGANSGEGSNPTISVDYGTTANTALEGNTTVNDVSVANLKTRLAGGFGSNAVTIGDSDDIVTIGNDLVITGDLTVNGDNLVANVTNLAVDDRYILLNSGSAAGDSGIVFGGSLGSANEGMALILDDSDDRLVIRSNAFDPDSNSDATLNATNHYSVVGAFEGSVADAATAKADRVGNIRVESEEIYIYV